MIALEVASVLFLATVIRSAFGFGEALVAVPLLALAIPIEMAAPVAVLVSVTVALIVVAQDWRHIHVGSAVWLVIPTFAGIPVGLILFKTVPEPIVKACLAFLIIAFSVWSLVPHAQVRLENDRLAGLFGFLAGILGGAYGMNGPPLAMYGSLRHWPPANFRATLQGYFLSASVAGMAGYWMAGLWTPVVSHFYVLSLPGVFLGIFLGRFINRRMNARHFVLYVHAGLIAIGLVLLAQAL